MLQCSQMSFIVHGLCPPLYGSPGRLSSCADGCLVCPLDLQTDLGEHRFLVTVLV